MATTTKDQLSHRMTSGKSMNNRVETVVVDKNSLVNLPPKAQCVSTRGKRQKRDKRQETRESTLCPTINGAEQKKVACQI